MKKYILYLLLWIISGHLLAQQALIPYRDKLKWGYADLKGKLVIAPQFQYATLFQGDYAQVYGKNGYGVINRKGKVVVPLIYDMTSFEAPYGKFDKHMNLHASDIKNRSVLVQTKSYRYGLYDLSTGRLVVDTIYQHISNFLGELCTVKTSDHKYGVFDAHSAKWIAKPEYSAVNYLNDTSVLVNENGNIYTIQVLPNGPGKKRPYPQPPMLLEELREAPDKVAVSEEAVVATASIPAAATTSPAFVPTPADRNDPKLINENGKYGFRFGSSFTGDSIAPIYDSIDHTINFEGVLAVKKEGKWGVVNSKGKQLLPMAFAQIELYNSDAVTGCFTVVENGKKTVVDAAGKVLGTGYDKVSREGRCLILGKGKKYGLVFMVPGRSPLLIEPEFGKISLPIECVWLKNKKEHILVMVRMSPLENVSGYISETGIRYFND